MRTFVRRPAPSMRRVREKTSQFRDIPGEIEIPYHFVPRSYQLPFLQAMDRGVRRAVLVWHRRCLARGTLIAMADGGFQKIEEVNVGEFVLSFDGNKLIPRKVTEKFNNGKQKVFSFNDLQATENHVVLSEGRWRPIGKARSLTKVNNGKRIGFWTEKIKRPERVEGEVETHDLTIGGSHNYIANGYIVHNCGKDFVSLNMMVGKMFDEVGSYFYFFPEFAQGRRVLWEGADRDGFRFMSHIPEQLIQRKNDTEMKVELKNGSIFQIVGTDKFDKKVLGTNVRGCVFSEYSLQDPDAWNYVRPILRENKGWAVFCFTPRGRANHGYEILQVAKSNSEEKHSIPFETRWFSQVLTVDDTNVFTKDDIETERREGTPEDIIQQEYYCNFNSSSTGAYYSVQLLEAAKRITSVPNEQDVSVDTFWDLGVSDQTSIWFVQKVGLEYHVIDYLESSGEGLQYYIGELQKKNYVYGSHFAPHDIEVRELSSGVTRREMARNLGVSFRIVKNIPRADGIQVVRNIFSKCWFDEKRCRRGIECLANYQKEWDERNKVFKDTPKHNFASHAADAFRYFAVASLSREKSDRNLASRPDTFYDRTDKIWRGY